MHGTVWKSKKQWGVGKAFCFRGRLGSSVTITSERPAASFPDHRLIGHFKQRTHVGIEAGELASIVRVSL